MSLSPELEQAFADLRRSIQRRTTFAIVWATLVGFCFGVLAGRGVSVLAALGW